MGPSPGRPDNGPPVETFGGDLLDRAPVLGERSTPGGVHAVGGMSRDGSCRSKADDDREETNGVNMLHVIAFPFLPCAAWMRRRTPFATPQTSKTRMVNMK